MNIWINIFIDKTFNLHFIEYKNEKYMTLILNTF